MDLATPVLDFLQRHGLENTAGIVAVSGGPDSIALAHVLVEQLRSGRLPRLILAHVNHQLRGAESDADEEFVRGLAASWHMADETRLICRIHRVDVAALAKAEKDNLENAARGERYRWFAELARAEGARWVATGHTADDQAETVLFRLLRGSGVLGLGGMPAIRPLADVTLIRPFLTLRRQALLEYLDASAIASRVDSSNRDLRFTRNRLRYELLPLLQREYNPAVTEVLCRLAEQARELHEEIAGRALQLQTEAELPRTGEILVFSVDRLQNAAPNLVREMFRLVWQREGWPQGEMDFPRWNRLVEIVQGTRAASDFPGKIQARRVGRVLQIVFV